MRNFHSAGESKSETAKRQESLTFPAASALGARQDGAAAPFFCFRGLGSPSS